MEVVNVINYNINVKGVVNTYPANMFKQYIERQNMTSYRSAFVDARCSNVKFEDHRDPTAHSVTADTVTSIDITCGDGMHIDVTPVKVSPSHVSRSDRNQELRVEATDQVRSVTPNRGNVKRDVNLTSGVKLRKHKKMAISTCVWSQLTVLPISFEVRKIRHSGMLDFGIR